MAKREDRHWWSAGMRRAAMAVLAHALDGKRNLQLLDAGCGTGGTTVDLREFGEVTGIDLAWEALLPAPERGLGRLARAGVEQLPFRSGSFDVVTSFEVIYHLGVEDDLDAIREFRRVLKPGGLLLLRVPAHDWLRGEHDRLVHTRHRYTPDEVTEKLRAAGFQVEQVSWANSLLFVPAAAKRLLERGAEAPNGHEAAGEPDLWQPPGPLNTLLEQIVGIERLTLPRRISAPFGLSVIALARAA